MTVLNNSYYSSKYRHGSYKDGCRTMPTNTREIDEFLSEFAINTRRYSIETKLASYGSSMEPHSSLSSHNTLHRNTSTRSSAFSTGTLRLPKAPAPPPPKRQNTAVVLYDITIDINPNVLVCKEGDGKLFVFGCEL